MTFLTFAILGSMIFFAQCMPTDIIPPVPEVSMPNYQENIEGFMKDMSIAAENHLQPLIAQLDPSDQQQVVEYGINSFINYIDYMIHVISFNQDVKIAKESEHPEIGSNDGDDDGDSNYDNDDDEGPTAHN